MNVEAYLTRIGYRGARSATDDALAALHAAHMRTVPFENLDIPLGVSIELDVERLLDKVVTRRRGGFCYELNGTLAWLLERLGFRVERFSARVYSDDGAPGPECDHMLLAVAAQGGGAPWIADVGFGDSFVEPVRLDGSESEQRGTTYRFVEDGTRHRLESRTADASAWKPQYDFEPTARAFAAFAPMCVHQQTSPASSFTRKVVCSRATETGRTTLSNARWIVTSHGERTESTLPSADEVRTLLTAQFGIELGTDAAHTLFRFGSGV